MIHVQTQVEIERPIEDVFAYVSDPLTFPAWNSAVHSVRRAGPTTYVMERNLPSGPATNEIEVVARVPQREFVFRTTSGPTPFEYRIRFTPSGRATLVELDVTASLRPVADLLGPLARATVKRGVDENVASLKALLERTKVSR